METASLDTESAIRSAVDVANVPTLLMVVFQMTGDERWLAPPYTPTRGQGLGDHDSGGLPEDVQAEIRDAAVRAISDLGAGVPPAIELPGPELTTRMMSVCMGEPIPAAYGEMLSSEFARRVAGADAPEVRPEPVTAPAGFRVVVIGAGVSGVIAAQQLEEMGIDYVILEKEPEPGGTWHENTYPGAGVDTPSHLYSFSFAKQDWEKHFELRDSLQAYIDRVMDEVGARSNVRFGTEVISAAYDEGAPGWRIEARTPGGEVETFEADALISAVGVLNRARIPELPGLGSFSGPSFHSSDWPDGLDLAGKRVAVVGSGASAMQIVPAIVEEVSELTVFQRSPAWVAPFEKFQQSFSPELRSLLQTCPLYHGWYWLRLFWQFGDKVIEALRVDPEWPHPERAVNARNDGHRRFFTRYVAEQLDGRDDLVEKVLPGYPPFGKRILLDNGWYAALRRENVTLVDEAVAEVRENGLVDATGALHEVDVVVWATGFDAARFLASYDLRGLGGVSLREFWNDDDPRGYLGVSVPGFPNLFTLGGPNSFPGSGSFMFFMEVQMRYIRRLMTEMFKRGIQALDVAPEANDRYNELMDEIHARTVWTHPGMSTYYRNSRGRVVFIMPFLNLEYWNMTQRADLESYTLR